MTRPLGGDLKQISDFSGKTIVTVAQIGGVPEGYLLLTFTDGTRQTIKGRPTFGFYEDWVHREIGPEAALTMPDYFDADDIKEMVAYRDRRVREDLERAADRDRRDYERLREKFEVPAEQV